jgi:hypothetical protein
MSSVTIAPIDAVLENAPYSVRLAARRAEQIAATATGADRRVHQRLRAADLQWLRSVRVKNGPEVTLVDLSSGGVLLDTSMQLKPGSRVMLEIVGAGRIEVASEVLRCHIAALRDATAVYRGACAFVHPIELERAQEPPGVSIPAHTALSAQAWQKIVVRYRDGQRLNGYTLDFHPSRGQFSLWPSISAAANDRQLVPMARLKAVLFVCDFGEDPASVSSPPAGNARAGRRIEVTFQDGEVVRGTTLSYRPDGIGFFMCPDSRGNTQRIFVIGTAVHHVRFP